jgi:uncharacterized small protein (DUF1192 family)
MRRLVAAGWLIGATALAIAGDERPSPPPSPHAAVAVDFRRDVRPILAENCLLCHGPDSADRRTELRFDRRDSPFADLGGYAAVVPFAPERSRMLERIVDEESPMPPKEHGERLAAQDIETLRRWIESGAPWEEHWAYVAPTRPALPQLPASLATWPRNAIDSFVAARLAAEGLVPAREASREALLRRVTFDLTGLPPAISEIDAFVADASEDAYERVVERLLASPAHAEHLARDWLDAARYGDTHGYHLDNERSIWRYRDWVIDAFAANMPFDRFTLEQLAGDLLPDADLDSRIATGFLRCNPTTAEGGLIEEEYLVKYAVDRLETVSTVWLGSTLACAQCHDHKYDPFSQREFYEFLAFWNNIKERGSDDNIANPAPFVVAPTREQAARLAALDSEIAALEVELDAADPRSDAAQAQFEAEVAAQAARDWQVPAAMVVTSRGGATFERLTDGSFLASGANPGADVFVLEFETGGESLAGLRLEALRHASLGGGAGRAENSNFVLGEIELFVAPRDGGDVADHARTPLVAALADFAQPGFPIESAIDGNGATGWAGEFRHEDRMAWFAPERPLATPGGARVRLVLRFETQHPRHAIGRLRIATSAAESPIVAGPWRSFGPVPAESYEAALGRGLPPSEADFAAVAAGEGGVIRFPGDRSSVFLRRELRVPSRRQAILAFGSDDGVRIWLDGEPVHASDGRRSLVANQERVTLGLEAGRHDLLVLVANDAGDFAFQSRLEAESRHGLPLPLEAALERAALAIDPEDAPPAAIAKSLRREFRRARDPGFAAPLGKQQELRRERAALEAALPTTLVAAEDEMRRAAHFLIRGQYDQKGEAVTPGVPAVLPPLPAPGDAPRSRLDLARWLVDPAHPLTARVAVNRVWQRLFGTGIVATVEDFGLRGEPPSHPELLDWLATEFVASGFDLRHLIRTIVRSSTYRQDSRLDPALRERDPANRLLARGPRQRLDAEAIRDALLASSGLLVPQLGGPSVKPYQPDGVWQAVAYPSSNTAQYAQGMGDALHRRSLYTFWKRTAPPPALAAFDAPSRESCTVSRSRTNTPLQALALMNDVQAVEAARFLAQRMLQEGGADDAARLAFGFRVATTRRAEPREIETLEVLRRAAEAKYRSDPQAGAALLAVGEKPRDPALDAVAHATYTLVASALLNLDETISK